MTMAKRSWSDANEAAAQASTVCFFFTITWHTTQGAVANIQGVVGRRDQWWQRCVDSTDLEEDQGLCGLS